MDFAEIQSKQEKKKQLSLSIFTVKRDLRSWLDYGEWR